MENKLYHEMVYIPNEILLESMKLKRDLVKFAYSHHFQYQMEDENDYKHYIKDKTLLEFALAKLTTSLFKPFEIETEFDIRGKERVCKIVVRVPFDDKRDITFAIIPRGNGEGFVKTAWLNNREDIHFTLDKSKYVSRK